MLLFHNSISKNSTGKYFLFPSFLLSLFTTRTTRRPDIGFARCVERHNAATEVLIGVLNSSSANASHLFDL